MHRPNLADHSQPVSSGADPDLFPPPLQLQHVTARVLDAAQKLVATRDFESLRKLLSGHQLGQFRVLVLLLGWDACINEPAAATQLLDVLLDRDGPHSSVWGRIIQRLEYYVKLTIFFQGKSRQGASDDGDTGDDGNGAALLKALYEDAVDSPLHCNVVHTLSRLVEFESIPEDELFELLQAHPARGVAAVEKDRDIMVLRSFSAIKCLADALETSAVLTGVKLADGPDAQKPTVQHIKLAISRAQTLVDSIMPITYRVETLENLFSLLFLRLEVEGGDGVAAGGEPEAEPQFLTSGIVIDDILRLLGECLEAVRQDDAQDSDAWDDDDYDRKRDELAARPIPTSISRVTLQSRIARLEEYNKEALWRLHLVRGNSAIGGGSELDSELSNNIDVNIIRRMLASPNTLLTTCLQARDFSRAQEVIQMFNIENDMSQDAMFAQQLSDMAGALGKGIDISHQIDALKKTLDDLATVHICIDLAVTAARNRKGCELCLDLATAAVEAERSGSVAVHMLMPFILKLKGSVSVVGNPLSSLILDHDRPMDSETIKAALTDEGDRTSAYDALMTAAAEVGDADSRERSSSLTGRAKKTASIKNIKTSAEHAMASFRAAFSTSRAKTGEADGDAAGYQYLDVLFSQLEILEKANGISSLQENLDGASLNPLRHLRQAPVEALAELIFSKNIKYDMAEKAASQLNLDLVEIIVRGACAPLELPEATSGEGTGAKAVEAANRATAVRLPLNVLADAADRAAAPILGTNPCEISYEVLQQFCTLLSQHSSDGQYVAFTAGLSEKVLQSAEYAHLGLSASALSSADYANMLDIDRLCCYSNIVNIMRLHACVVLGPPQSAAEWVQWSKSVTYSLGGLGKLSLFELEFSYLRASMPVPAMFDGALKCFIEAIPDSDPRSEFLVRTNEPSLQYGIWHGWASSPTPVPLQPGTYQGALQNAKTLYLLQEIEVKRRGEVFLPRLVEWFARDFFSERTTPADIFEHVAANLPAGSSTHAYVLNASAETISYASYSFAPLCRLVELNAVDPRQVTSYQLQPATLNAMLYGERRSSIVTRSKPFDLDDRALSFLDQSSHVVKLLACLVGCMDSRDSPPESGTTPDNIVDRVVERLGLTTEERSVRNFIKYRLDLLGGGVVSYKDLSSKQLAAFLLDTNEHVRRRMCYSILDDLVLSGRYKDCVRLIDSGLFMQSAELDLILCADICKASSKAESWRSVSRLQDKVLASTLALQFISDWDVDISVDTLNQCKAHLGLPEYSDDLEAAAVRDKVANQVSRLQVYSEILQHHRTLGTWKDVMRESVDSPQVVVRRLIDSQHFDLARRWANLHDVAETEIEQNYLLMLLDMDESLKAHQVLSEMADDVAANVCRFLMTKCKHLRGVVFIVRYMVQSLSGQLKPGDVAELELTELGAFVLQELPLQVQMSARPLIAKPQRIIEHLLMNKHVEQAKIAVTRMGNVKSAELLGPNFFRSPFVEREVVARDRSGSVASAAATPPRSPTLSRRGAKTPSPRSARRVAGSGSPAQLAIVAGLLPSKLARPSPSLERKLLGTLAGFKHDLLSFYAEKALLVLGDLETNGLVDNGFVPILSPEPTSGPATTQVGHVDESFREQVKAEAWRAVMDDDDQLATRQLFEYGQAPSTALCIAIIDMTADPARCGDICLHLCSKLSDRLAANPAAYDHYFMINSIRRLLYNAKLKFLDCGAMSKIGLCDAYLSHAELLRVLLSSRVEYLLSITDLIQPGKARRLRDRLIEDDKMDLALQVALKCNLDTFDVWSSWGRAKLSLGQYEDARTKFERCLQQVGQNGANDPRQGRALNAIVSILEAPPCPAIQDILHLQDALRAVRNAKASDVKSKLTLHHYRQAALYGVPMPTAEGKKPALMPPRVGLLPPLEAVTAVNQGRVSLESPMSSERFHEASWYLQRYGSAETLCNFFVRHGFVSRACDYVLKSQVIPKVFVDTIFKTQLNKGAIDELKDVLDMADPTLQQWNPYLMATCRYLSNENMIRTLYDVQVYMKDEYRAGITSVGFARAGGLPVEKRLAYLQQGLGHFEEARRSVDDASVGSPAPKDLRRYIKSVELQTGAVSFLNEQLIVSEDPAQQSRLEQALTLSLFGGHDEKLDLCVELIDSADNFTAPFALVTDVVQFFELSFVAVFAKVAPKVALKNDPALADEFLAFIGDLVADKEWDSVVRSLVDTYFELDETRQADKMVQRMKSPKAKIDAQIACKKLKAAYLVAVRAKQIDEIRRIYQLALESENRGVVSICEKFLESQAGGK